MRKPLVTLLKTLFFTYLVSLLVFYVLNALGWASLMATAFLLLFAATALFTPIIVGTFASGSPNVSDDELWLIGQHCATCALLLGFTALHVQMNPASQPEPLAFWLAAGVALCSAAIVFFCAIVQENT